MYRISLSSLVLLCFGFNDVFSEDLKWTQADQWLLRKCLGSVRGLQRFSSFLKGTAGVRLH